ncbi:SLC13 family permease [Desulfoplanes formicivorans]|uniref:Potassium transporter TrkA n=1 Tax=Desulfoplanes formicivorans TaxID=1592317 RepID=A0A194AKX4_9BACT|nr:SLC13 family permease [Desulfoplanes formicivorans]GAU09895.1 potassium transporter TrkA [Desulfoplanes formicivorans]
MTPAMEMVMAVLVMTIILFVVDWVRVDVVGLIMMIVLPLLGLVTPEQAISGLSSNAVVSIIAVIIIGAGLDKTGAMNTLSRVILRFAGNNEGRIVTCIAGTVALISGLVQNIGAAALFLPAAKRIANQTHIPPGRILMPMAFLAIIGGCLTLVGSSPLILLNDLMVVGGEHYEHFGLFSVTPIGLCLVAAGLAYFLIFGKLILPSGAVTDEDAHGPMSKLLANTYAGVGTLFEIKIPDQYKGPQSLAALRIRPLYFCSVVAIRRGKGKQRIMAPGQDEHVYAGDHLAVVGSEEHVRLLIKDLNWILLPELSHFAEDLSPNNVGIMEAIVTPRSQLRGKTLAQFGARRRFHITPLAIFHNNAIVVSGLSEIVLQAGDALLLHGQWKMFHLLKDKPDLVFTEKIKGEILRKDKATTAVFWLGLSLTMILGFHVQLSIALLTGAVGMILTKVLSVDEAYASVDWMTIFLLAGLIPLGMAFENTGTARFIATAIMNTLGTPEPLVLTLVIALLTSFFTLFASNVGATVLLVPLAMNMANQVGMDPRVAALTVALAASNTFILPTHQVNALVMRPGHFTTGDFVRAGTGMTLIYLAVMIGATALFYGL